MDQFVAEIRIFPFNFPPKGWAFCDGQLLLISQNTALFSLLGTTYGGDGRVYFALPNLQGSAAMHPGQGPGLSLHDLGEAGGSDTVTLLAAEMTSHAHAWVGTTATATDRTPSNESLGMASGGGLYSSTSSQAGVVSLAGQAITPTGGDQPHNNMQPYLTLNFCIAMVGVYPPRT